ncbi:MAG: hypothetical protein MUP58_03055 [Candidatus Nanohaloarchaeota archaeon QJJ-9]|nr:hypothetical protein [Candidatus Nanohaloarchaeota archaeon QJJ-9]
MEEEDRRYGSFDKPFYRIEDDMVFLQFLSGGCPWKIDTGGCTICTFEQRCYTDEPDYIEQFEYVINQAKEKTDLNNIDNLLLFNRSFYSDSEISPKERKELLSKVSEFDVSEISVESRPEVITSEKLRNTKEALGGKDVSVYIGVESTNDFVRKYCIHKGLKSEEIEDATNLINDEGMKFVPFILTKPPFMSEKTAIKDATESIEDVINLGADRISLQAMHVYDDSLAYDMSQEGLYRSPWLWSLNKILENLGSLTDKIEGVYGLNPDILTLTPEEIAHNCGECDGEVKEQVKSLEPQLETSCECIEDWKKALEESKGPLEKVLHDYRELSRLKGVELKEEEVDQIKEDFEVMY